MGQWLEEPGSGGGGEGDKEESEVSTLIMWTATVVVHTPLITLHITLVYFMPTHHIPSFLAAGAMMQSGQHVLMDQSSIVGLPPHKLLHVGPPLCYD